ncbi:MAG: hypothetical protein OEY50_09950, partial [Nitrospinota bacterium]|nr:hypothetical protein [Nitrospinota bacterium]
MKIRWIIGKKDINTAIRIIDRNKNAEFVKARINKNIKNRNKLKFNKAYFWQVMLLCLFTTQQKSSPQSPVNQFFKKGTFPLGLETCAKHQNSLDAFIEEKITKYGGIRRAPSIGREAFKNYLWLSNGGYVEVQKIYKDLIALNQNATSYDCIIKEREIANFISSRLLGFGPKQSRNMCQELGLFRYEIPIDSRIAKWFNSNGFPFKISPTALADHNYYEFVMNGIQQLCEACQILPCVLD